MSSIAALIKTAADAAKPVENLRMMEERTMDASLPDAKLEDLAKRRQQRVDRGTDTTAGAFKYLAPRASGFFRGAAGGPATLTPPQQ